MVTWTRTPTRTRTWTPKSALSALSAVLLPLAAVFAEPSSGQLVAITEDNATGVAANVWALNSDRTVDSFLSDATEFSDQFRSLVSYAAANAPIEVGCSLSGSAELSGMVGDDSIGVRTGEAVFAEFKDCSERDFLDITLTRSGTASLTVIEAVGDDKVTFDISNDYSAVVDSAILPEPVRGTFAGTTRYDIEITPGSVVTLTAASDIFSVFGSTPAGTANLEVRDFLSSLVFTGADGVLNYAKSFVGRFDGTPLAGAVIVTTDAPLNGIDEGFPQTGGFSVEGAAGSKVSVDILGGRIFLYVDADGDGSDDDLTPAIFEWPAFEALVDN